eukprot:499678-Rhodomonas_salina.2
MGVQVGSVECAQDKVANEEGTCVCDRGSLSLGGSKCLSISAAIAVLFGVLVVPCVLIMCWRLTKVPLPSLLPPDALICGTGVACV